MFKLSVITDNSLSFLNTMYKIIVTACKIFLYAHASRDFAHYKVKSSEMTKIQLHNFKYGCIEKLKKQRFLWVNKQCFIHNISRYTIGHVYNIPTMQFFIGISRNTLSKSYTLLLTECVWEFQKNALWDTH